MNEILQLESVQKLARDLSLAAKTLSNKEARYLVDLYYQMQDNRVRSYGQVRALSETEEPHTVINWAAEQSQMLESQIKKALDKYTDAEEAGKWAKSNLGIGPVLSAGLCANIGDATRFATCGDLWAYCGLVPGQRRKRGEKSNWSSSLKRLAWLIGQSFVKVSGNEDSFYGKLYKDKKAYYVQKNDAGYYSDRAAQCLNDKNMVKIPKHINTIAQVDCHQLIFKRWRSVMRQKYFYRTFGRCRYVFKVLSRLRHTL